MINISKKKKFIRIFFLIIFLYSSNLSARAEDIVALYKYLHANPELSWQEDQTSELLSGKLESYGFNVTRGVGKKGVVAKAPR